MSKIETIEDLEKLYGTAVPASTQKVMAWLHPIYRRWIERSRFAVLTTVGPEGTDGTPRGDDGPVVQVLDDTTLAMPDWRGNNRLDSLRNIVRDGRVSCMFMVPGSNNAMRVNGQAHVSDDADLLARFERKGILPRTVIVIEVGEVYFQCARALVRSELWSSGDQSEGLPTAGEILDEVTKGELGGPDYDAAWPARAKATLW